MSDRTAPATIAFGIAAVAAAAGVAVGCGTRGGERVGHAAAPATRPTSEPGVQVRAIRYTAHNGRRRLAYVLLPAWYGPDRHPPLPLVISPHGRGANGRSNAAFFGNLPAVGGFAVVSPDGMGRSMRLFSYGYPGQVDDLARLPRVIERALPWLRIDDARIYALGSSMGGQEAALLVARHPRLLAGAAVMDAVTDLARRYRQLAALPCGARCLRRFPGGYGRNLQANLRRETGGTPASQPAAYAARSALAQARSIASSGVRVQLWWSSRDRIVFDQRHQTGALYRALRRLAPCAPVSAYRGEWAHSHELRASALLPFALADFGLLPRPRRPLPATVEHTPRPACEV
jgi:pimeloyl-ACP methyl ester carboxylesterase